MVGLQRLSVLLVKPNRAKKAQNNQQTDQLPNSWFGGTIVAGFVCERNGEETMEYVTISAKSDGHRYVATYRKWFSEKLGAWELELVPGTLRWLD
jgi:hypothetical protein